MLGIKTKFSKWKQEKKNQTKYVYLFVNILKQCNILGKKSNFINIHTEPTSDKDYITQFAGFC